MALLFVVQKILDCDIPEEMKIYQEKTGRKRKVTGCHESGMAPLFVVQEILDCDIPEEMKIYQEKTDRKRKVTRCHESKKDPFVHAPDPLVSATWFEVDSGSSVGLIQAR